MKAKGRGKTHCSTTKNAGKAGDVRRSAPANKGGSKTTRPRGGGATNNNTSV